MQDVEERKGHKCKYCEVISPNEWEDQGDRCDVCFAFICQACFRANTTLVVKTILSHQLERNACKECYQTKYCSTCNSFHAPKLSQCAICGVEYSKCIMSKCSGCNVTICITTCYDKTITISSYTGCGYCKTCVQEKFGGWVR
jgi:hypothetical protein